MIVQPEYVDFISHPHYFDFYAGFYATDSAGRKLPAGVMGQPVNVEHIRINHYWCGSQEWLYTQKVARREKWGLSFSQSLLDAIDKTYSQVEDLSNLRFLPRLKARPWRPQRSQEWGVAKNISKKWACLNFG